MQIKISNRLNKIVSGNLIIKSVENKILNNFIITKNKITNPKETTQANSDGVVNGGELPPVVVTSTSNNNNSDPPADWWSLYWLLNQNTDWLNSFANDAYLDGAGVGGGGEGNISNFNNFNIIDSLQGYPCAQAILLQMPSLNSEVHSILYNVFGINEDVNLKFSIDQSYTKDSADGYTKFPGGSASFFSPTIKLNPWVLNNSTREYVFITMLHEGVHAFIDYWWNQYLTHQIDSTQFKSMFPIFWDYKRVLHNSSELSQHNEMAYNYIFKMQNAILAFSPSTSNNIAQGLAWGGLHFTTAWRVRSDTNEIKSININSRDISLNQYQSYGLTTCN